MAQNYTYAQFEQAAKNSGLYGQFSDADLKLAQRVPDAGMSLLQYKKDYLNATTDEARALANSGAESVRSAYGNYTAGTDGSGYYLEPISPSSFPTAEAPTYTNRYDDTIQNQLNGLLNYQDFSYSEAAPTYTNRYDATVQAKLNELLNRGDFSYDAASDPLYSQYKKAYTREGQRATQDALGTAAAATGGIPSSYAASAASQAGNYYAAQIADKIPELEQIAYDRYLNDYQLSLSDLNALQTAEQNDYSKYLAQLDQYNTDRNFAYQKYTDDYSRALSNLSAAQNAEQNDYSKYLAQLDQYNTDRNFNYSQWLDEIENQKSERQEKIDAAQLAANYGDYSRLNSMGIDTSNNATDWERQYTMAQLAANYGDYSRLNSMGIDTSNNATDWERQYTMAQLAASVGDFSQLRAMGIDTSAAEAAYNAGLTTDAEAGSGEDTTEGGMAQSDVAAILATYPNGVVTDESYWNMLKNVYGEDALTAAGLSMGGSDTSGTSQSSSTSKATDATGAGLSANGSEIYDTLQAMKKAGASGAEILQALKEAWNSGAITSISEYNWLLKNANK